MQNDAGEVVDVYIPRRCSASGRIIGARDKASVQINVGNVDEQGRYTGTNTPYVISGFVRGISESDDALNRLTQRDGITTKVFEGAQ